MPKVPHLPPPHSEKRGYSAGSISVQEVPPPKDTAPTSSGLDTGQKQGVSSPEVHVSPSE
jgi:hypothetical protein